MYMHMLHMHVVKACNWHRIWVYSSFSLHCIYWDRETGLIIWTQSLTICLVWLDNLCQGSLPRAEMTSGLPWPHGNYVGAEDPNLVEGKHFTFWAISLAPWMGKFKGQNGYNISPALSKSMRHSAWAQCRSVGDACCTYRCPIMVHTYSHTYVDCMF